MRSDVEAAMAQALGRSGAAVLLRVDDGRVLAWHNRRVVARRAAAPGSTVKPFVLERILAENLVDARQSLPCDPHLTIDGRAMACAHPRQFKRFAAVEALAFSCNSYFAQLGGRLPPGELESLYRSLGFAAATRLAPEETVGRVETARNVEQRRLLAIGVEGLRVTPLALAAAYRRLALIDAPRATPAQGLVLQGLRASVSRGMASSAEIAGWPVSGKTGTASDHAGGATHAWFAGFAPSDHPEVVLVVYVEGGSGAADAAPAARRILQTWRGGRR